MSNNPANELKAILKAQGVLDPADEQRLDKWAEHLDQPMQDPLEAAIAEAQRLLDEPPILRMGEYAKDATVSIKRTHLHELKEAAWKYQDLG